MYVETPNLFMLDFERFNLIPFSRKFYLSTPPCSVSQPPQVVGEKKKYKFVIFIFMAISFFLVRDQSPNNVKIVHVAE